MYALHTPVLPELAWRGPLGRHWPKVLEHTEKVPPGDYPTASLPSDAAHGAWLYRDNIRARLTRPRADAHAHAPVQLVVPLGDKFLSPRLYDDLERWVPRLTRRTVDARHWLPRSRPDQLTAWIAEFVTRHEDDGEGGGDGDGPDPSALADDALPTKAVAPGTPQSARAPRAVQGSRAARAARPVRDPYAERFGGQLVLVTGAGGGIGRATALAFARAGARIVAVDRDPGTAARTALAARAAGAPGAWGETVDVGDERAMEKLAARVASDHGVVDILVNNAGIGLSGSFLDTTPGQWRELLDVNLWGVIHGWAVRRTDGGARTGRSHRERRLGRRVPALARAARVQHVEGGGADAQRMPARGAGGAGDRRLRDLSRHRQHRYHHDDPVHRGLRRGGATAPTRVVAAVPLAELPAGEGRRRGAARGAARSGGRPGDTRGPDGPAAVPPRTRSAPRIGPPWATVVAAPREPGRSEWRSVVGSSRIRPPVAFCARQLTGADLLPYEVASGVGALGE